MLKKNNIQHPDIKTIINNNIQINKLSILDIEINSKFKMYYIYIYICFFFIYVYLHVYICMYKIHV